MRQNDDTTVTSTATIQLPAVVPVLERKTRRVSFAETDDIRFSLMNPFIPLVAV